MGKNKNLKRILVVSFEAGSAEIISELLKKTKNQLIFKLNKITKKIFLNKGYEAQSYNKKFTNIKSIYFGASFNNEEINFIKNEQFKDAKKFCILDHWVYYKKRLNIEKKIIYKIYVFDRFAKKLVSKLKINNAEIILKKNPLVSRIKKSKNFYKKSNKVIIFLNNVNYYQNKTYHGFLSNKKLISNSLNYLKIKNKNLKQIYLKLHPANDLYKYKKYIKNYPNLKIVKSKRLDELLCKNNLIISNESMVLYLAHELKLKNINITKNLKTLIPKRFCSETVRIK